MKKDRPIFVQFLFKSVQKPYNYCNFSDRLCFKKIRSILKMYDFCTIYNNSKFRIRKMCDFGTIFIQFIIVLNLGYERCAILVRFTI